MLAGLWGLEPRWSWTEIRGRVFGQAWFFLTPKASFEREGQGGTASLYRRLITV